MRLMTKKEMKQDLKEVNKRKKFREALLQLVKNRSMSKPEIKIVYVPIKVEEDNLPKQEVCALNDSNMLVGHLRYHGKGVIRPIVFVEDEHQEMGNITHWLNEQQLITFTPEGYNKHIQEVIDDALNTAAEEAEYECLDYDKYRVNKESIINTSKQTFEKWKI